LGRKSLFALGLFVVFLSLLFIRFSSIEVKAPNGVRVWNIDTGLYYTSIQEAINANETLDGHSIFLVISEIFYEHVVVNKSISLRGATPLPLGEIPIINGNGTGTVVTIEADNVMLDSLNITSGVNGVALEDSDNCSLGLATGLWVIDNSETGVYLHNSRNCTIKWLETRGNKYNFGVEGSSLEHFSHEVVSSTADGKPICYLTDKQNINVADGVGYIAVVNCTYITIENQSLTHNHQGIMLAYTNKSVIRNNMVTNNLYGIYLQESDNNTFYHNNLINNIHQVRLEVSDNYWDSGVEGNYWSDYTGVDLDPDGMGDTPHIVDANNMDNYPLMGMFYDFSVRMLPEDEVYRVQVISNSSVRDLGVYGWLTSPNEWLQPGQTFIQFLVEGEEHTTGFCRIVIPRDVVNGTSYTVLVGWNSVSVEELAISNSTHACLYFTYQHSEHEVIIVPEFPPMLILPLSMITTLLATLLYRRKSERN